MDCSTFRISLCLLLCGILLLPASFAEARQSDPTLTHEQLIEQSRQQGRVAVIIEFNLPFRSLAVHDPAQMEQQRAEIALTSGQIMARHDLSYERERVRTYSSLPFMALWADEQLLRDLLSDPNVRAITPNEPSPPSMDVSNNIIGSPVMWDLEITGEGTVVAVLDTGVDSSHPHFGDRVVQEVCYSTDFTDTSDPENPVVFVTSLCPDNLPSAVGEGAADDCPFPSVTGCGHGTHVAGTVAGSSVNQGRPIDGVAKDAQIIAMQVFSLFNHNHPDRPCDRPDFTATQDCVLSYPSDQIAALNWLFENTADYNIVAANMSLGGGGSITVCDNTQGSRKAAMDNLKSVNIATVVASGNNGFVNAISVPACISTAISVGSVETGKYIGTVEDRVSGFSNSADFLDLLAPGHWIENARPDGNYEAIRGTSMAAPHVAGAWALYRQAFPNATVDEVLEMLQQHGEPVLDDRAESTDFHRTTPRLQIDAAMLNTVTATSIAGANTGNYTGEDGEGWRLMSAPVDGASFNDLFDGELWLQGPGYPSNEGATPAQANLLRLTNTGAFTYVPAAELDDPVGPGNAVAIYVFSDHNYDGNPTGFPKEVSVKGLWHRGDVEVTGLHAGTDRFSLVGNPFSRAISFDELLRENIGNVVYVYDHAFTPDPFTDPDEPGGAAGGGFRAWNGMAGSLTDGLIGPFQGFLVYHTGTGSPELTIPESAQVSDEVNLFRENPVPVIQLAARINGAQASDLWLSFSETGSLNLNPFDAEMMYPLDYRAFLGLFTEADGRYFDIKNLPAELTEAISLPLHVYGWQPGTDPQNPGYVPITGSVELIWPKMANIPADWTLTLTDHLTGEIVDLREQSRYVFSTDNTMAGRFLEHEVGLRTATAGEKSQSRLSLTLTPGQPTDIQPDLDLPRVLALSQNYPNPFNPTTQIRFELPAASEVRLEVFNIQGQRVAVLVNENRGAGIHTQTFDASALSSGVYIYRLQAGNQTLTRKMTLIK